MLSLILITARGPHILINKRTTVIDTIIISNTHVHVENVDRSAVVGRTVIMTPRRYRASDNIHGSARRLKAHCKSSIHDQRLRAAVRTIV